MRVLRRSVAKLYVVVVLMFFMGTVPLLPSLTMITLKM